MSKFNVIGTSMYAPIGTAGTEPQPETIAIPAVAKRLGISKDAVYRGIRLDHEQPLPRPRIPGGRLIGDRFFVIRAEFERSVRDGILPEPAISQGLDVQTFAAALRRLADQLAS